MSDLAGQSIKGYQLLELLGAGSFGEVYHAHQTIVERDVAIKIILPVYANHPDFIRRFEAEAQLVARVEHPFIVPLYDYWREPNSAYLVMRWLRGGSLKDLLKRAPQELDLERVVQLLEQISSALATAHQNGVVHRDLKPANILLDEQGNAYLTDFGIAKDLRGDQKRDSQETVVGSPAYLSPEQVQAGEISPLSDIYSLGILLYELLTGERPFRADSLSALLVQQIQDPLPDVRVRRPDLSERVNEVLQKATAKKPQDRYSNPLMLAAAFRRAVLKSGLIEGELRAISNVKGLDRSALEPERGESSAVTTPIQFEQPEPDNPYKGLRPFQEADAADFFGRQGLVNQVLDRLREDHPFQRFLGVVGPSGSGKSSVIMAGVLPALRRGALPHSQDWFLVEMLPGAFPFEELEAALLRVAVHPTSDLLAELRADPHALNQVLERILPPKTELFLLIDQFEEIFTQVDDEAERETFLNMLYHAVTAANSRLRVVITLRADFYDKPLYYKTFGEILRQRTEVVLPLAHDEILEAIVAPAQRVGLQLESGLPQEIIADVMQQPGALPLLQYALLELFERRDGRLLTLKGYQEINGVSGALARRAEKLYQTAQENLQPMIRQVFIRLVALGEGTEDTRRRIYRRELSTLNLNPTEVQAVIDMYGKYRLLTFDYDPISREPTIEVAHEALIRQWQRLRDWINEIRDDLRQYSRVSRLANEWATAGRDESYLVTGAQLTQLRDWMNHTQVALNQTERDYIHASVHQYDLALAREAERQAREEALERRSQRFLQAFAAALVVGLLGAIAFSVIAMQAREDAEASALDAQKQQQLAEASADIAQSLVLVANARNAVTEGDNNLALRLAIAASDQTETPLPEAERMLSETAYSAGIRYQMAGHESSIAAVEISPDQTWGVSVSADGMLLQWDLTTGTERQRWQAHTAPITSVAISPDGTQILTGSLDKLVILWDAETGAEVRRYEGHLDQVNSVAFSPDGLYIASGGGNPRQESPETVARIWDRETGEIVHTLYHLGGVLAVKFTPDSQFLATTSGSVEGLVGANDKRGRLWSVDTGGIITRYEGFDGFPRNISFSPDGTLLAIGAWDNVNSGTIRVFDLLSGQEQQRLFTSNNIVTQTAFMPDGKRIMSASWDNSLRLWDIGRGVELKRFLGHGDRILAFALSPNGEYALTGTGNTGDNFEVDRGRDNHVRWVDLNNRAEFMRSTGHTDWLWSVAYRPDGELIATGSGNFLAEKQDNSIRLWNPRTGEQLKILAGHTNTVDQVIFSPDGTRLVSASWDGLVLVWDYEAGEIQYRLEGHTGRVMSADYHPTEPRLLSIARDKTLREWNPETGEALRTWDLEGEGYSVEFSPDGATFATADADGRVILWDFATGEEIRRFEGHANRVDRVTFSPDGLYLATASSRDTTLRLWEVATGQEIRQFFGHVGGVTDVIFDPQMQYLVSGGSDGSVRVWDWRTGEELRRYLGHTDWVVSVAMSPDGQTIISGSNDLSLRYWLLARNVAELEDWAQANRYIPVLTCDQKETFNMDMSGCE